MEAMGGKDLVALLVGKVEYVMHRFSQVKLRPYNYTLKHEWRTSSLENSEDLVPKVIPCIMYHFANFDTGEYFKKCSLCAVRHLLVTLRNPIYARRCTNVLDCFLYPIIPKYFHLRDLALFIVI